MAEHKVFSACPHDCPDTCAMITTVRDGKAIDVRGNPDHPFTRGGLCVKVNDYQNRVYSPDRVLYPLKRTGRKGSGEFQRVSWDAALGEIKTRWSDIIDRHGPTAILPYSYLGTEGLLNGLNTGDAFLTRRRCSRTDILRFGGDQRLFHVAGIVPKLGGGQVGHRFVLQAAVGLGGLVPGENIVVFHQ